MLRPLTDGRPGRASGIMGSMTTPRRTFDERAREWDDDPRKRERAVASAAAIRERISLPPDAHGLELGCGTGLVSFALQDRFSRIVLADTSAGMLEVLREKVTAAGLESVFEPRAYDLTTDPLPPDRFDAVYSSMVLHHIPDTRLALMASRALMRPGGYLLVADLEAEDGSFHGPDVDVHHGFDADELGRRALDAGFVEVSSSRIYGMPKTIDGIDRVFPLFLLVARAPRETGIDG